MEIVWFIFLSVAGGIAGLVIFISQLRTGQFEDVEDVKYQMFREDEDA